MRRLAVWTEIVTLVVLCAGTGFAQNSDRALSDRLAREMVQKWREALNAEDLEGFVDCYWDDAVRIIYFPGEEPDMNVGKAAVSAAEGANFEQFDFTSMNMMFEEPLVVFPDDVSPTVILPSFEMGLMNVFEFEMRFGYLRIIRQYVFALPAGP